ncbi:MAG: pilus assembly protein PilM [Deltaproteobacteria bacterium]|nr:pilus assembly protein PilM [Deltaproteobacteria bacterium]
MPKTALGILLTPGELLAVRVRTGWRGSVVDLVTRREVPAPDGGEADSTLAEALGRADPVVAALRTDEVFYREVELPFGDLRRLTLAAPLEAEESLPLPLEELVCDVYPLERSARHSRVLVAAAPTGRVGRLLTALRPLGLIPQIVDVEALALATVARLSLPPGETALILDASTHLAQVVVVRDGLAWSFHAFSARTGDPELVQEVRSVLEGIVATGTQPTHLYLSGTAASTLDEEAWSQDLGLPVRRLPFPRAGVQTSARAGLTWPQWAIPLGLALRGARAKGASPVNLLKGPFAPPRAAAPWRQTAVAAGLYAAVLVALWGATAWTEASNRREHLRALDAAIRQTFQAAVPEVRNVVSEVDQLRTKVTELETRDRNLTSLSNEETSPVRILRQLSASIPRDIDVEFRDLSIDPERVRIEGSTTSFRESERIKAAIIAADPRFASVTSDAKDGAKPGEVLFTLTINLAEKR